MKLKVISGGDQWNTRVINAENGEELPGVISVTWNINGVRKDPSTVTIQIYEKYCPVELKSGNVTVEIISEEGE